MHAREQIACLMRIDTRRCQTPALMGLWGILLLLGLLWGCSAPPPQSRPGQPKPYKINGTWYQPLSTATDFRQVGLASWYGKKFHGRRTSNGEIYDMYAMTAAHKTLPLNTWVRVTHRDTGKSLVVRVNDRGPFVRGRIIDLSYTAAKKIGIVGPGTGRVEVVALGAAAGPAGGNGRPKKFIPQNYDAGNFTFQVGAFSDRRNAERLKSRLAKIFENAHINKLDDGDTVLYRVRVGKYVSLSQIVEDEALLARQGFPDAFVVAE